MKKNKRNISSELVCKATASLESAVTEDLDKTDGDLKNLLKKVKHDNRKHDNKSGRKNER